MTALNQILAIATDYRTNNPRLVGGVVLIWRGAVYGWKNSLRDPFCERPGVIAVDADNHVFIAEGGDDASGAKVWSVMTL